MIDGEMLHFVDVLRLDRSDVVAVVDPEPPGGLLEDFRHECPVRTAAVEIVLSGPYVVEARRHAAHRRRLALRDGVLRERLIDADMHMGIDAAGKRQIVPGVENLPALLGADVRGDPIDLSILDRDVEAIDRRLVRPHDPGILDHKVKRLTHSDISLLTLHAVVAMTIAPKRAKPARAGPCHRRRSARSPAGRAGVS